MSKTFTYTIFVLLVYFLFILPINSKTTNTKSTKKEEKDSSKNSLGMNKNEDENGVSQGASGRLKYQIGID